MFHMVVTRVVASMWPVVVEVSGLSPPHGFHPHVACLVNRMSVSENTAQANTSPRRTTLRCAL